VPAQGKDEILSTYILVGKCNVNIKPPSEMECENKALVRKYSATIKV
jgi:hypothetical protein